MRRLLIFALAIVPSVASAQVAVRNTETARAASVTSLTLPTLNVVSGDVVGLCLAFSQSAGAPTFNPATGVTFNGSAVTAVQIQDVNGITNRAGGFYYFVASATANADVVITLSGSSGEVQGGALSLSGVNTSSVVRSSTDTTSNTTSISATVSATNANDMMGDCYVKNGGNNEGTAGANQTQYSAQHSGSPQLTQRASYKAGSFGSATMSWTIPSGGANVWMAAASFQAAASAVSSTRRLLLGCCR